VRSYRSLQFYIPPQRRTRTLGSSRGGPFSSSAAGIANAYVGGWRRPGGCPYSDVRMFWFMRKKLFGSYFFLSATSRS